MEPPIPAAVTRPVVPIPEFFELRSVFGEGREGRWEIVQRLFKEQIQPYFNIDFSNLLKRLPTSESLKTRLLCRKQDPVGIVVYHKAEEDPLKRNLGRCMEIRVLFVKDQNQNGIQFIIQHLVELAKEHHVNTLFASVASDSPLLSLLEKHEFKILRTPQELLCIRSVVPLNGVSRKRLSPVPVRLDEKKGKMETQPANGIPKVMSSKLLIDAKERQDRIRREAKDCSIKMQYFNFIEIGSKTVEGRIKSGMFASLREGQYLRFFCGNREVFCEITGIKSFKSFSDMLKEEGVKPCLPDVNSVQQGVEIYNSIPGYADKARRFGVLAIHIKRVTF